MPFLLVPATWLVLGLIFLVGFRVGLNVTNSNVIDVGYSGVIGADRITDGEDLYGRLPGRQPRRATRTGRSPTTRTCRSSRRSHGRARGTTCPPRTLRRSPSTCSRCSRCSSPAAMLRARVREGNTLGLVFAYAWAAYPYTLFVLNSNANDSLIALLVTVAFLALAHPRARGAVLALAASAKFAPLALVPLWASYRPPAAARRDRVLARVRRGDGAGVRARGPGRRRAGAVGPHRRVPARARLAVQHLGPGGRARLAPGRGEGRHRAARRSASRFVPKDKTPLQVAALGSRGADRACSSACRTGSTSTSCGGCPSR